MKSRKTRTRIIDSIFKLLLITLALTIIGCSDDDDDDDPIGNWIELSDFEGVPRTDVVTFTIDNIAYVGTGYDGEDRLTDFWKYDASANQWKRIADFPGVARNGAVGFAADNKGYVGTGYDGDDNLKDFWQYDPVTDSWTQVADFGGSARYGAVAFSIDNIGYVGTGYDDNALKDIWAYDAGTNTWIQKSSVGGGKRQDAVAFVINGKGYICTGIDNGVYENDFWQYDPVTDSWDEKREISDVSDDDYDDDYTSIVGIDKVAFTIDGKGYVATGGTGSAGKAVWEYRPNSDLWERKTSLEASSRIEAVGFAIGETGYLTTGRSSSYYFDDLWGFKPNAEQKDLDKSIIVNP